MNMKHASVLYVVQSFVLSPRRTCRLVIICIGLLFVANLGGIAQSTETTTTNAAVRLNVDDLNAQQIDDLRKGVTLMQSRPESDPASWIYQANIHGSPSGTGAQPAWDSCQHGGWFFLSWHRMYLYYMEKILRDAVREATGDPGREFSLPYWNYSDSTKAHARSIPLAYRQPADGSNVLFVSNRNRVMNLGGQLQESAVSLRNLGFVNFSSPAGSSRSFGGQRSGPGHSLRPVSPFEITPHGVIHMGIGGGMASFGLAARDPVFWLHHANIDRLWERWLSLGDGRSNPTGTQGHPWLMETFDFFDVDTGSFVTMTGADVVNTSSQLGYTYDSLEGDPGGVNEPLRVTRISEQVVAQEVVLADREFDVVVAEDPVTIEVQLEVEPGEPSGELIMDLYAAVVESVPEGHYEVYVNLAEGEAPTYPSPTYLGNMAFFGAVPLESVHFQFSLSETEQHLKSNDAWDGSLSVTVAKTGPVPPGGFTEESAEESTSAVIRIGSLRITRN